MQLTQPFNLVPPVDCEWSDWQIGECSQTCRGGTRTNFRKITKEANHGGTCDGKTTMKETCNEKPCPRKLRFFLLDFKLQ